jgi:amidase
MPTVPIKPPAFGDVRTREALLDSDPGSPVIKNTGLFDVTHHTALTVPCGETDGAPVGLMFVGKRFDDAALLRLGYACEQYDGT